MKHESMKMTMSDGVMLETKLDRTSRDAVGIVHIFHGMAEHMNRYTPLVEKLNDRGYHVIRHNHRGHGVDIEGIRGHYDSMEQVVSDAYEVQTTLRGNLDTTLPCIVLGHSMGSIIARQFAVTYPNTFQGLILSGTGYYAKWQGNLAKIFLKLITLIFGRKKRLNWVNHIVTGRFNKQFKPSRTPSDWLSTDEQEVDKFMADPYSGFNVSNQLVYSVTKSMMHTGKVNIIQRMNTQMPVLLISGKDDPFGENGKGVRRLASQLKKGGVQHITVQLYPHKRHEVLFDHDYETVWKHMLEWISRQIIQKREVSEKNE
ncbi:MULTISPECIES: lysophospholipase [unclassified Staphylococcus]|uniref:lysophospholipase n=1 Tax=unclassified Staphylococcus TaxID=91994 RepID=UPI0021D37865|nr:MULTISPECIES: lysophospholipase [unclassified Staphylococcus]UXR72509.1 alpha/beta hydrolase [Staphylococcus sp. IVB6240]UXR74813.1 alpha/beta hydrolase [Staphylococcus sp. IVB6238]UXR77147.1 alpha/beta hydrolase [Staphylococcus sp. IVB6233]UXR81272.1 alpha/beta hydrolase [Staphylococcus sp. IVB6218]